MSKSDTSIHILDTAIDLFWRASYHGVNMNALSQAAGVNKATVYQHFTSKEELAVAAVRRAAERTRAYVFQAAFDDAADPVERLRGIYQRVFESHKSIFSAESTCLGCPFVNIGVELATSSDHVREAVNEAFASFRTFYETIVEDFCRSSGDRKVTERQEIVSDLLANMNACLVASKLERRPDAILDGRDRALRILQAW